MDTLIIGGGISGLTVAHKLRRLSPGHQFCILEKTNRTGGAIWSHAEEGYLAENGPHGFLDNCAESRLLLEETGLEAECVKAPLSQFVRYICLGGALRCIPQQPLKILLAPLISPLAKLRVMGDLFTKPLTGEPTVAQWVERRFGPALLPFADAVFTGTYAGDSTRLVIDGVMPGVRRLEMTHGSVLRGLVATMREKRRNRGKHSSHARKGLPAMTSFPRGMEQLPAKLATSLQINQELRPGCTVTAIRPLQHGWEALTDTGCYQATNLVLALPINSALALLQSFSPTMPQLRVPEAKIVTIALGFGADSSLPPGFGYLAPEQENRFCLGALFSSNMFPNRAPQGHILLEALVGGRRHPERLVLDDQTLIHRALDDLRPLLPLRGQPAFARVLRASGGIPQMEAGHSSLLAWRDQMMRDHQGLFIHGFGWEGIGINDMTKQSTRVAQAISDTTNARHEQAPVKGVYF